VVVLIPPKILTQAPAEDAADFPAQGGGYPERGQRAEGHPAERSPAAAYGPEGGPYQTPHQPAYQTQPSFGEHAPAHARPAQDVPGAAAVPLPKRRRGQTLAAAQHGDLTPDPMAGWLDPSPEEEARAARSRAAAGGRFSAFREAAAGRSAAEAHASAALNAPMDAVVDAVVDHGADAEYAPAGYPADAAAHAQHGPGRYGGSGRSGVPGGPGGYGEEGATGDTMATGPAGPAGSARTGPAGGAGGDSG